MYITEESKSMNATRAVVALASAAVLTAGAVACSAGGGGGDDSDPIRIGAISTLTGPGTFPESTAAAQAFFDQVNADGGINGRSIEYQVVDDAQDGGRAAQAARQLVDQESVVALVGSASAVDCATNAQFYASRDIASLPGVGIEAECFSSSNIAPTNTGLFTGVGVSLVYAVESLGKSQPCVLGGDTPSNQEALGAVIDQFEEQTGVDVLLTQTYPADATDFSTYLLRAQQEGCDTFIPAVAGPALVTLEKQATSLGLREAFTIIELSSAYSEDIAAAIQPGADGLVANSEFLPFTGSGTEDEALSEYVDTMEGADVSLNAFGQGGFVAAQVIVDVLREIDGDVTPASVLEALQGMEPFDTPLMGNPYEFGDGDTHQPNRSSRFVSLEGTVWQPLTEEWTTLETGD